MLIELHSCIYWQHKSPKFTTYCVLLVFSLVIFADCQKLILNCEAQLLQLKSLTVSNKLKISPVFSQLKSVIKPNVSLSL